ncbi:MAG TPA: SDR family NAD(P)-dependent oxidoreductase [Nocardioides sp.]|uniref:SDR family NAD(P)-dependent oxidoreductase n=1 Tax=Nocardioides sp. TaxID=35761 RepID=UPI002F40C833
MSSSGSPIAPRPLALVTGPTAGLGRVFVDRLARRGYDLVLVARDEARLKSVADELTTTYAVSCEVLVADLVDREQLKAVEDRVSSLGSPARPPVDLLVNNAGFGLKRKFLSNTVEEEQAHLDVLVTAPMRLMHAALRQMTERHSGGILNVSSVAGTQPRGSYSAAKAYLNRLGEWAAHEYAKDGVHIMTLLPGFTRTEFHQRMDVGRDAVPGPLWLDVERVVDEALADFDAGKRLSIPTKRYKVIAHASKHLPVSVLQRFQSLGRR